MNDKRLDCPLLESPMDRSRSGEQSGFSDAREMTALNNEEYGTIDVARAREITDHDPLIKVNRTASGRKWFSWWIRRKGSLKPKKPAPVTWTVERHRCSCNTDMHQSVVVPRPLLTSASPLDHYTDNVIVDTLQDMFQREGFGDTRRDHNISESATVENSIYLQSGDMYPVNEDGFVSVEDGPYTDVDMTITKALGTCNKYVLGPYNCFLKLIGWRSWRCSHNDRCVCVTRVCDVIYPLFIFVMLLATFCAQILICFSRTQAAPPQNAVSDNQSVAYLSCGQGLLTTRILPDLLNLVAYVWAWIVFRRIEPEHLSALIATVFLSYDKTLMGKSQKRMMFFLLSFLIMGIAWIVFSAIINIVRLFSLQLDDPTTVINWLALQDEQQPSNQLTDESISQLLLIANDTNYQTGRLSIAIFSLVGFVFIDFLYVAVIINYSCQCQLLIAYVNNLKTRTRNKSYLLGDAVKEIYRIDEFMTILNGNPSYIMSLVFFNFIIGVCLSTVQLTSLEANSPTLNVAVGFLNILQWFVIALIPVIQAARLTSECRTIRTLGLEIGARPFVFSDTPQLVLDSFVNYTSSVDYKAKLASVPIYPEAVVGLAFVLLIAISVALQKNTLQFAYLI